MQLLLVSLCPGPAGSYPKFGYGCRRVVALLILSSKGIIHSRGVPVTPSFLRPTGSYPKFGLVVVALLISSFLTRSYLARDASVFCSRTPRTRSWASVVAVAHAMSTPEYSITFQHSLQRIKVLQHFAGGPLNVNTPWLAFIHNELDFIFLFLPFFVPDSEKRSWSSSRQLDIVFEW